MPFHRVPLVYVSGKYTAPTFAEVQENIALAVEVARVVQALGAEPLVPHLSIVQPLHEDPAKVWKAAMRSCLVQLSRCDLVVMVPNWKDSRGARLERFYAKRMLGIPVYDTVLGLAVGGAIS